MHKQLQFLYRSLHPMVWRLHPFLSFFTFFHMATLSIVVVSVSSATLMKPTAPWPAAWQKFKKELNFLQLNKQRISWYLLDDQWHQTLHQNQVQPLYWNLSHPVPRHVALVLHFKPAVFFLAFLPDSSINPSIRETALPTSLPTPTLPHSPELFLAPCQTMHPLENPRPHPHNFLQSGNLFPHRPAPPVLRCPSLHAKPWTFSNYSFYSVIKIMNDFQNFPNKVLQRLLRWKMWIWCIF